MNTGTYRDCWWLNKNCVYAYKTLVMRILIVFKLYFFFLKAVGNYYNSTTDEVAEKPDSLSLNKINGEP